MRRITIIILTFAAAVSLWSCKLSDGTSYGREYADRMLWERTSHSLSDVGDVCRHTALAGILYGIGDEAERRLVADRCCHGATVEIGANAVSIEYRDSRGEVERRYCFSTGGSALGTAPWRAHCLASCGSEYDLTLSPVGDGIGIRCDELPGWYAQTAVDIGMSYLYDADLRCVTVSFFGSGRITERRFDEYTIDYRIEREALCNSRGELVEGCIDILYNDLIEPYSRHITVTVSDGAASY